METEKPAQDDLLNEQAVTAEAQVAGAENEKVTLMAKLEEKTAEAKANYELFVRERAELENFKRRMQREKAESVRFANEPLLRDVLPVLDNLERAISHAQSGGDDQPLAAGVTLVARSFLETLEKHGVTRVGAKGEPFDPSKHEAMAQVESLEIAPNTVIDEYCPAYFLHGRLLRPALVTVARASTEGKKAAE